jgi:hypothetical protein
MGTAQLLFEREQWEATGGNVTGSHVTGRDLSHVTGSVPVQKYALRMRNRKLRNSRPSGTFSPEVSSVTWLPEFTWPEENLSGTGYYGSMFCACPAFPSTCLTYYSSSTTTMATECDRRSRDPNAARGIFP